MQNDRIGSVAMSGAHRDGDDEVAAGGSPGPHAGLSTFIASFGREVALLLIRLYQYTLSGLLPPACRFWPSCSRYGYEAIARHGLGRGGWLTVCRLARCHPFNPGGYDPVR
jgi:uncharacterized protein